MYFFIIKLIYNRAYSLLKNIHICKLTLFLLITYNFYCINFPNLSNFNSNVEAPSDFIVTGNNTSAELKWTTSENAIGYNIYRFEDSENNFQNSTLIAASIREGFYTDNNLLNGSLYFYYLTTLALFQNSIVESPKSKTVSLLTIPLNVSNLQLVLSRNNIALSWDTVQGATNFKILRSQTNIINKNSAPLLSTSNINVSDSSIMPNTSYFYTVLASNATGDSILTSATINALTFPGTPANLSLTATNNTVNVIWNNPINNAISYNVYRSTSTPVLAIDSNKINNASIISSPYVDNTTLNGLTYNYVVTSVNTIGESLPTTFQSISIIPDTPTLFLNSINGNTVVITWTSVLGATYYNILRGENNTPLSNIGSTILTSFTDTNVNWGSIYNYKINAANSGGTSANSNNIIIEIPPTPPNNLSLTSLYKSGNNTGLNFIWNQVASMPTYNICKTNNANEPLSSCVWLTTGSTSNVRIGYTLPSSGSYAYFRVVSVSNTGKVSAPSNEIQVLLLPPAPVLSSNGINTLNWTVSNSATSYKIYRASNFLPVAVQIASVTGGAIQDNNFIDNNFPKNVDASFYYVVSATNNSGDSDTSNLIIFDFTKLALSPTLIWTSTTGGNYNLNITGTAASSNTWTLTSSTFATTWTSLNRTSGSGNLNVNLNVFVNNTIFPRKAIYTLMSNFGEIQILTINQLPLAIIPSSGTNIIPEGITRIWVTMYSGDGGRGGNGGTVVNNCSILISATNGQNGSRGQGRSCELIVSENSTFSWHIGSLGGDGGDGNEHGTGGDGGIGGMLLGANGTNGRTRIIYSCVGLSSRGGGGGGGGGGGVSYIDYNGQKFYTSGGSGGVGGNGSSHDSNTSDVAPGGAGGNGGTGTSNLNCTNTNNLPARTGTFSNGSIRVIY